MLLLLVLYTIVLLYSAFLPFIRPEIRTQSKEAEFVVWCTHSVTTVITERKEKKSLTMAEHGFLKPNPALLDLELRKPKRHLAHELGEGAKCLTCGDGCPGFQLHYWR